MLELPSAKKAVIVIPEAVVCSLAVVVELALKLTKDTSSLGSTQPQASLVRRELESAREMGWFVVLPIVDTVAFATLQPRVVLVFVVLGMLHLVRARQWLVDGQGWQGEASSPLKRQVQRLLSGVWSWLWSSLEDVSSALLL